MANPRRTTALAWKDVRPFSCSVGECKLMTHFVVSPVFLCPLWLNRLFRLVAVAALGFSWRVPLTYRRPASMGNLRFSQP